MATTKPRGDPLWAVALGVVAVLLVATGLVFGAVAAGRYAIESRKAAIEGQLVGHPEFAPIYDVLHDTYPEEAAELDRIIAEQLANQASPEQLHFAVGQFMARTSSAHRDDLIQAPSDALMAIRRIDTRMITAMEQEDVMGCAHYVMTGMVPASMPLNIRQMNVEMHVERWIAAADGRDRPAGRRVSSQLPLADQQAFVVALRAKGMTDDDLMVFSAMGGIEPWRQCAIGRMVAEAIDSMPEERGARLAAMLNL